MLIENSNDKIESFDSRCDEGIFLGYSSQSKAYKCYNKRLNKLIESVHMKVDEVVQDKKEIRMDTTFLQENDKDLKEVGKKAYNKVDKGQEEIKYQIETL